MSDTLISILEDDAIAISKFINFNFLKNKKILITGGLGLIGINMSMSLIYQNKYYNKNIQIHISTLSPPDKWLLNYLKKNNVNLYLGDITNDNIIKKIPTVDFIIHAAGYGQPKKFLKNSLSTYLINSKTTIELFRKLPKKGSFLYLSSSEIYSGNSKARHSEDDMGTTNTSHFRSSYIMSKKFSESLVFYFRKMSFRASSARVALTYGPGIKLNDDRVLNEFIFKSLKGSINLNDRGEDIRTYLYIRDAVIMLFSILKNPKEGIYNVGGNSTTSIYNLAKKIALLNNVDVKLPKNNNKLIGSPRKVKLNINLIKKHSQIKNLIKIDYGLTKTISWIKALTNIKNK